MPTLSSNPNQGQVVLGIDPGTRVSGYGVVIRQNGRLCPKDFGCIRTPSKELLSKRYLILFNGVEALLEQFQPDAVAVETQFVHKNVQSAIKLGIARGMIILAATKRHIPIFEYAPSKAKIAVVGNGRGSKEQVQAMVQKLLALKELPKPDDAADALALAICHLQAMNSRIQPACQV